MPPPHTSRSQCTYTHLSYTSLCVLLITYTLPTYTTLLYCYPVKKHLELHNCNPTHFLFKFTTILHNTTPYTPLLLYPHHHGCPSLSSPFNCSFPLHIVLIIISYLPLRDQMAMSQICTFLHDVVAYIKTTLDFSTLTIYPTYQNDIRGKKRFIKTTFINLPVRTILSNILIHSISSIIQYMCTSNTWLSQYYDYTADHA